MIDVITCENAHEYRDSLPAMLKLRHHIFIERYQYAASTPRELEWNQFDTPKAHYLCWCDKHRQPRGLVRILPTSLPTIIRELWPDLIETGKLSSDNATWQWTRLSVDQNLKDATKYRIVGELICGCMEFALQHQIGNYVFVTPKQVVRTAYQRHGVQVELLGQEKDYGGFAIIVGRILISTAILAELRRRHGIQSRMLRATKTPDLPAQTQLEETTPVSAA